MEFTEGLSPPFARPVICLLDAQGGESGKRRQLSRVLITGTCGMPMAPGPGCLGTNWTHDGEGWVGGVRTTGSQERPCPGKAPILADPGPREQMKELGTLILKGRRGGTGASM